MNVTTRARVLASSDPLADRLDRARTRLLRRNKNKKTASFNRIRRFAAIKATAIHRVEASRH
jgi:hypothetical protein